MPDSGPSKPSLDELLRVKRAERPPSEFWKRFEDELRAKQLAAIVAPRPWWQSLSLALSGHRAALTVCGAFAFLASVAYLGRQTSQDSAMPRTASAVAQISIEQASTPAAREISTVAAAPTLAADGVVPHSETPRVEEVRESSAPRAGVAASASVVNPILVAAKFSEAQVLPPRSAMEMALPTMALTFSPSARTEQASHEPLAAIPTPREQRVALIASVADVAMLATPAVSSLRSRTTPRDSDLRARDLGRVSAQGNALVLRY
jgi:hypothetical protein